MRTLSIVLSLFLFSCSTITSDLTSEDLQSTTIIENLDKSKSELFSLTNEWLAKTFKDSKSVIEVKDEDRGKIVGKGYSEVMHTLGVYGVTYTLTIDVQDNRVRIKFENIGDYNYRALTNVGLLTKSKEEFSAMAKNLEAYIKNSSQDDKW